ncbi:MAG: DNA mismatch repair protein MutS [Chloroflexi bacterium]|nr:DNA mismatch repair protein MutS [Chloroflexota bacterium]
MSTPVRRQYLALKAQHPDALLLFRMGDFYEAFDEDAGVLAETLGIALTSRPLGKAEGRIPMAGVPHHALERYLDQLVGAGHRVALAEQTSEPAGRTLVERRVVRVVTPGTVEEGALLPTGGHNWLVAVAPAGRTHDTGAERFGLAACDVTTGELECMVVEAGALAGELARRAPRELLVPEAAHDGGEALPEGVAEAARRTGRPARQFAPGEAARVLREQYGVADTDGFGLRGMEPAVAAAGALLAYLGEGWPQALRNLREPRVIAAHDHLELDPQTVRTLELFESPAGPDASLVAVLDRTRTGPGGRLLRARLARPVRDAAEAGRRLDEVQAWVEAPLERAALRRVLRGLPDPERLLGRVRAGSAGPRQLAQLRAALGALPEAAGQARATGAAALDALAADLDGAGEAHAALEAGLAEEPPAEPGDGASLRAGFAPEVDELRALAEDARGALTALEAAERERTGLGALKVGYHRVFGYYLELPRAQAGRAPEEYEPRQTLAGAQRYRHAPLSELEDRILGARDRLAEAERAALERLCARVAACGGAVERAARALARLDVAAGLAEVASEHGYVRPVLRPAGPIAISGGRHPVIERRMEPGAFVPNDTELGGAAPDVVVLTGPNMGGKSTYLRQTALIVLMAQAGSYVPAESAGIGMCDRVFTRVGASDELAAGRSTFMREMVETAEILRRATERSLVVLDEVGRGTSTGDGLAIARAVVEALHHRPGGTPRTLFATHYRELTALAGVLPRVANRSVAVAERSGEVVFLHRITEGAADRAYGVHVAALAGLPRAVVARARELLAQIEAGESGEVAAAWGAARGETAAPAQLALPVAAAPAERALAEAVAGLEPDELSPLEALQRLYELRAEARRGLGREG